MKTLQLAALITLVAALCSCVPSIHELYTEKDLVFDPALTGKWLSENEKDEKNVLSGVWEFTKAKDGKSFDLAQTDPNGRTEKFVAHLVKLDDKLFLDVYPSNSLDMNALFNIHFISAHTFMAVKITASELQFAMMNPSWLRDLVTANPDAIKHETTSDVILTADTKSLQDFVTVNLETKGAFEQPTKLARKP